MYEHCTFDNCRVVDFCCSTCTCAGTAIVRSSLTEDEINKISLEINKDSIPPLWK